MWTTGLEATPKGTELGSSTSFAIRTVKAEFKRMLSVEHAWDADAAPEMNHIAGDCTVCGLENGTPTPLDIAGALWWDYDNERLYRDAGGGLGVGNPIVSFVHADLDNLSSATAHTNYVLVAGDTIQDVEVPTLEGLSVNIADYTDTKYVLSQAVHLTTPAAHDAGSITNITDIALGLDKFNNEEVTVISAAIAGATPSGNILVGRYSFWPFFKSPTTQNATLLIRPMLDAAPPADYVGGYRIHNPSGSMVQVHMAVKRLL